MNTRLPALLIVSHLAALGAGWWIVRERPPEAASLSPARLPAKSERLPRPERRVSTADLLAAYRNPELWGESLKRRSEASRPRAEPPHGTPAVHVPAEQRAAEIADIAGAMQKELEAVDAGKSYDYQLTQALVARWMKEDPAACAAWLGQMKMRTGWGDPFVAFAQTLPPGELLALMEQGWLQVNRRRALDYLAAHLGGSAAADLPAVLSALGEGEAEAFLQKAAGHARVEDATVWLTLLEEDPQGLNALAARWIWGTAANEREMAELALAAAAGTPAEEIFRRKWEAVQRQSERQDALTRIALEPAEAAAALIDHYARQGHDEAEARQLAGEAISQSYRNGLDAWQREAWEQDLQLSLLGQRKLADVLAGRLEAIQGELPEVLQEGTRNLTWRDALMIDPAATFDVARQQGRIEEARQNAATVLGNNETSVALQAEILLALAKQGLWNNDRKLPAAGTFVVDYLRDDPDAAHAWITRLPGPLSDYMEVTR